MKYSGNDINIIHLSDLHIRSISKKKKGAISSVLRNLLIDITDYAKDLNEIILVVSGDIIDKADYSTDNINAVKYFFTELKNSIGDKVKGIVFSTGNHDIIRSEQSYSSNNTLMNIKTSDKIKLLGYESYLDLVNNIYNLFKIKCIDSSFGLKTFTCNDYKACFVFLDTAWSTTKPDDCKQGDIYIGDYQMDSLIKAYQGLDDKDEYITFVVSHYPMAWIHPNEQEKLKLALLSKDGLNADIYLCGHIHDVDSIHYSTHEHSILTLVTGIGWPPSVLDDDRNQRRYSIYRINPARNTCDIVVRISNKSNKFNYDTTVYTEDRELDSKKIVYPLRSAHKSLAFLPMNTPDVFKIKNIHISQEIADKIKEISMSLSRFNSHMTDILTRYKQSVFEDFYLEIYNSEEKFNNAKRLFFEKDDRELSDIEMKKIICENVESFLFTQSDDIDTLTEGSWKELRKSNRFVKDLFEAFLSEICQKIIDDFYNEFPHNAEMRVHFREHSNSIEKNEDFFRCICHKNNTTDDEKYAVPRDIEWGGLIEHAFKSQKSLVFSANMNLNKTNTDWQEFITIIPWFNENINKIRATCNRRIIEERPRLTFGISIKGTTELHDVAFTMTILDFLGIETFISTFIEDYLFYLGALW